uniref:Uncharacterized protein n=1 Tax=Spongospora subterranea TaxID=70186 RepID=A0A0H5RDE5_9EUKA|eukprot:CRZ11771.1 hypothetical protein [Spongospora subterranea]
MVIFGFWRHDSTAIDDCSIVALLQIVDKNNNLSELRLSSNQITVDGAAELAKTLPSMRQLLLLDLSNDVGSRNKNVINDEGLTVLCNAISKNFSLLSLNLVGNNINELDAASIGQVLRLNLTLTHLDLDRNKLGTRGAQILFEALARNKALRHLSLAQNGIGADAVCVLLVNHSMRFRRMNGSQARAINTMLVNNNSLVALHLQNNSIGLALPDLAEAMLQNRSIVVLDLQGNGIVDAGATAFAHVLASNIYLTNINLSNNNIGQAGGIMISKALAKNKVLTSLDISSNDIKDESAISIAEAMVRITKQIKMQPEVWL